MKYLVDANVLSEATRPRPAPQVIRWLTALVHGFTVATRNRRDFKNAGVEVVDPFVLA